MVTSKRGDAMRRAKFIVVAPNRRNSRIFKDSFIEGNCKMTDRVERRSLFGNVSCCWTC